MKSWALSSYHFLSEHAEMRNCDCITRANREVFTILLVGFQNSFFKPKPKQNYLSKVITDVKRTPVELSWWVKSDDPGQSSSRDTGEWHDRRPAEISDLGVDNNQAEVTYGEGCHGYHIDHDSEECREERNAT